MRDLLNRFLSEAPVSLQRAFAFDCADRAVRVHALSALREGGFPRAASRLERLLPVTNRQTALSAAEAAKEAELLTPSAKYAARVAQNALDYSPGAAAQNANMSAFDVSSEWKAQAAWIRKHWGRASAVTKETLAAVDAYIADGLLLGDDE
jgi:hypothetical protein